LSTKRLNGSSSEVEGCKTQQTRKDLSFRKSFFRSYKKGDAKSGQQKNEEKDDSDDSMTDTSFVQAEPVAFTGAEDEDRAEKENEVNIHELGRYCRYLLSHSLFLTTS
jgi:hypothetical protein